MVPYLFLKQAVMGLNNLYLSILMSPKGAKGRGELRLTVYKDKVQRRAKEN